ncbi:MAG TPA: hypothetical protein VF278_03865 [Pirellulales bacterium]
MRLRWFALVMIAAAILASDGLAQSLPLSPQPPLSPSSQPPQSAAQRGRLNLPSEYGATAASSVIAAQAAYIVAMGDFLESAAIARRHNAVAAEHEMKNAVLWVQTYFERRELNRAYRLKESPDYRTKETSREETAKYRIEKLEQLVVSGDVTNELNWMVRELASTSSIYQLMTGPQSLADSTSDQKLELEDVHHIRLTDGAKVGVSLAARAGGPTSDKVLVFRADAADPTETRWPRALRTRQFDEPRKRFETAL